MNAARPSGFLLCLSLAAFLLWGADARAVGEATAVKGRKTAPNGMIAPGSDPIPFALFDLEGNTVSLADYQGKKAVLLAFWSFFCGPCREEIPLLDEITKKYADQGVVMLAINLDGPKLEKAVKQYVAAGNFGFRVLWEELEGTQYKTADAYGVLGTPSSVLIGMDGKVSWTHVGREEGPAIEEAIRRALVR
jgi:thiol-disulfide isomerase/thioredoxin